MKKEPEIIYLTGKEKLQDKIAEIEGGAKDTKVIIIHPPKEYEKIKELLDDKIADENISPTTIKYLADVVNKRTKLIEKIVKGEIKNEKQNK